MNILRTITRAVMTTLWSMFGGLTGATIFFSGVAFWGIHSAGDDPMNGGESFAIGILAMISGVFGFFVGLFGANYLRERWSLFKHKPLSIEAVR